jgi:hypothetical protein
MTCMRDLLERKILARVFWFRDSGNLSSWVVVIPARFGDHVMHVRFDIGSLLVFCWKQTCGYCLVGENGG